MAGRPSTSPAHSHAPANERFVVERCLGEGSMGAVFKAFDRERGQHVALKTLRRVDASGIYRFKQEFRAIADVSHPNLVQLHELFSEGSEWFFSMELVEGQDFLGYVLGVARPDVDPSPRPTRELRGAAAGLNGSLFPTPLRNPDGLCAVLRQVVQAVMALHAVGKLHRDLKPDNVMVTSEGRAVVLDFGITAERSTDSRGTMEGGVMGTPAYMSPEQAAGGAVDEATDWYALGAMLYEALTGQVPFDGTFTEVLEHKQLSDPPPPSALVSGVPESLDALCMSLLCRDPKRRPRGSEILDALGGVSMRSSSESSAPFLGRQSELAELERALAATDEGAPVVAFLHGMTGMGKTALCEQFLQRAELAGAVALRGRCYEHEVMPFKALDSLVDALSRYLGRLPTQEAAEVLPKDIHALCQLFPVLERVAVVRMAKRRGRLASDPGSLRQQATHALKDLFTRIAMRQQLVIAIDDLQWGDVDSARLLAELVSGLDRPALLCVFTYRTADKERSPCVAKLRELLHDRLRVQVREVILRELREPESVELAAHLLGESQKTVAGEVARESRGSPYLITQLIDHLHSERRSTPPGFDSGIRVSLERALSERLDGLSSDARTVLELVAVSGRPVRERVVAELLPDLNIADALAELRRGKLVRGVGGADARALGIYHDSLREAVLAQVSGEQVRDWHRRLARLNERGDRIDQEALIEHLLGAGDHGRAAIFAIGAARSAMEALAFDRAAELYEVAVKHHEDGGWRKELIAEWADALVSAGRSSRAAEVYLQAAADAPPAEASAFALKAGVQFLAIGQLERGAAVLGPPLRELGIELPKTTDEAVQQALKLWPVLRDRGLEFVPRTESEVPAAVRRRLDALWSVAQAILGSDPVLCQVFVIRFLLEALDAGERTRIIIGLCAYFITIDLAYSTVGGGKPRSLQRAEALCANVDDPRCQGWLAYARAFAFENQGLLKPASLDFAAAEDLFRTRCRDTVPEMHACRMLFAHVLGMLGQLDDLGLCEQWMRDAMDHEDAVVAARMRFLLLPRLLADDDVARGREHLEVSRELLGEQPGITYLLHFNARANIALYEHDKDALLAAIEAADVLNRSPLLVIRIWRSDYVIMRARILLAASRQADHPERFLAKAERAIDTIGEIGLECHVDHARMLGAALAARRGDKQQAIELLDSILADADMVGDSRILLACARLRRGQLVGGELGAALVREGERALLARGVKHPQRFARVYAPGFDEASEL